MKSSGKLFVVFVSLIFASFISCTDENVCGEEMVEFNGGCIVPVDTEPTADLVRLQLQIPDNFDATPVLLNVCFFDNAQMVGIPVGFGEQISNPEIAAGDVRPISSSQANLEGDYYMSVIIYCEGGGNGRGPMAGVDWVGSEVVPVTLGPGTQTIDVGDMTIVPFAPVQ